MRNLIIRNILRFFLLIFIQVMILNKIYLGGYVNPYFYVYFVLLLPLLTPQWIVLITSFLLGLGIDIFTNTTGLNASATTLMAFCRFFLIRLIAHSQEELPKEEPSVKNLGFRKFLSYSASLILIHHLALFYLEIFRFSEFFHTGLRVLESTALTLVMVIVSQYLFHTKEKNR